MIVTAPGVSPGGSTEGRQEHMANDHGEEIREAKKLARDLADEVANVVLPESTTVDDCKIYLEAVFEVIRAAGIKVSGYSECCGCSSVVVELEGPDGSRVDVETGP